MDGHQAPELSEENNQDETGTRLRGTRAHMQYTIPPKEVLETHSDTKKLQLLVGENVGMEQESTRTISDAPKQSSSPNLLRASTTSSASTGKRTKGNLLQASLEFGIAGVSLKPPSSDPTPPSPPTTPARMQKSKSQSTLGRFHGLFSPSSSEALQSHIPTSTTPPTTPPTTPRAHLSSSTDEFRGFFKKITSKLTHSTPHSNNPLLQHNFRIEFEKLLPPPQAPAYSASNLTKIIHEIIATEWEYLGDLLAISEIQNFMLTNHVVEQVDAMRIFGNVDQILMANLELYRTFQKNPWNCKESTEHADLDSLAASIAEAFEAIAAYLRMYAAYSSKHEDSLKVIKALSARTDFRMFVVQLEKQPVCKNLSLSALLIKPIQRVCKYPLLLRELLKYVDNPVTHPKIEAAMAKIEETLLKVNEHQKMADRVEKMAIVLQELIDGGVNVVSLDLATRRFVSQGPLHTISSSKKIKEGHYYLFVDLFLWTRRGMGSIKLEATIPLKESLVLDIVPPVPGEHGLEIVHAGQKKWQFFVDKPEEAVVLKKLLTDTIENAYCELLNAK